MPFRFAPIVKSSSLFAIGLFSAAVMLSSSGCKPEYPACKRDKHCNVEEGERCVDEICQNCVTSDDCRGKGENGEDQVCVEYRCVDGEGPNYLPGELGSPCASINECNQGLVCREGKCSACLADSECSPATCNLDTGRCEEASNCNCQVDDDCAMDEVCENCQCTFPPEPSDETLCGLDAIYFDFDSPKLTATAVARLNEAAQCISSQNRLVNLEAHADPRGTVEYNILLTDKRGQAVKNYLSDLGVPRNMMNVVAKGHLEAIGTDESGWARDRRVQFEWK